MSEQLITDGVATVEQPVTEQPVVQQKAGFPITLHVGGVDVVLNTDGILVGDMDKFREALENFSITAEHRIFDVIVLALAGRIASHEQTINTLAAAVAALSQNKDDGANI